METRGTGYQWIGPFAAMEMAVYARVDRGTVISSGEGGQRAVVARVGIGAGRYTGVKEVSVVGAWQIRRDPSRLLVV